LGRRGGEGDTELFELPDRVGHLRRNADAIHHGGRVLGVTIQVHQPNSFEVREEMA
jgi:hypothetical protein